MRKQMMLSVLAIFVAVFAAYGQCDVTPIAKTDWEVHYFSSEETIGEGGYNGRAYHAIDDLDFTYWHTEWKESSAEYPHEYQIDLGGSYDVVGFALLSRNNSPAGKPKDYEFYLSENGTDWNLVQSKGSLSYPDLTIASQTAEEFIHPVTAKYVRFVFLAPYEDGQNSMAITEIDIYTSNDCMATGQDNQVGVFEAVGKRYSNDEPFDLVASTNSDLPITYEVVSGPAAVEGATLTLTGEGGEVVVKAKQTGNAEFYPWEATQTFTVVNLSTIEPVIMTRFTDVEELKMTELSAYLLYAYAKIDEPEALSVTSLVYEIDGETIEAEYKDGAYQTWWTPSEYGVNTIKVIATGSNGVSKTEIIDLVVSDEVEDRSVFTIQDGVIDWGTMGTQWFYGEYVLPQFVGAYDEIIANFSISCPDVPGGCDDWDRLAWIEVKNPYGEWIEFFRYITPYGVACEASLDVTDYASLLQGNVEFRMYIETWGTGGWQLNLEFDYIEGTPEYKYSNVETLWHGDYSFGDPSNLQPVEKAKVYFDEAVDSAVIRLVSTGHGWGNNNSQNAAEFYHARHHIYVDEEKTFEQDLWKLCNPNPDNCTGQQGTWQHNRAGWCPGSTGMVFSYDLSEYVNQEYIALDYIFQENYVDYCHPNNPNCVSGVTCQDCNDGYNPYYRVGGYVIKFSNTPSYLSVAEYTASKELEANLYPNPTSNTFKITLSDEWNKITVRIMDITGQEVAVRWFSNSENLNQEEFDISDLPNGVYFIKVQTQGSFTNLKVVKQ